MITSTLFTLLHVLLTTLFGYSCLHLITRFQKPKGIHLMSGFALGLFIETLFASSLFFLKIQIHLAVWMTLGLMLCFTLFYLSYKLPCLPKLNLIKPKWYEIVLGVSFAEKILFGIWQLYKTPIFFDDTMTNWAGRARTIFGQVNWSFDPNSASYLGFIGHNNYPLGTPMYKVITAVLNNGWDDFIARADSLIFFVISILAFWTLVHHLTKNRFLAAASTFLLCALPLQGWHVAAGYNDIVIQAYITLFLISLIQRQWFIAGIFATATAWMKNDGLVMIIPGLTLCTYIFARSQSESSFLKSMLAKETFKNFGKYLLGLATLTPWLIIKAIYIPAIAPMSTAISWHSETFRMFWQKVIYGPTHNIFILAFFFLILVTLNKLATDRLGQALLAMLAYALFAIFFVFGFTEAYEYLETETTVHRSILQYYGLACLMIAYGVFMSSEKTKAS